MVELSELDGLLMECGSPARPSHPRKGPRSSLPFVTSRTVRVTQSDIGRLEMMTIKVG